MMGFKGFVVVLAICFAVCATLMVITHGAKEQGELARSDFITYLQDQENIQYTHMDEMSISEIFQHMRGDGEVSEDQYDRAKAEYDDIYKSHGHKYDNVVAGIWATAGIGIGVTIGAITVINKLMAEDGKCFNCGQVGTVYRMSQRWQSEPAYCKRCWSYYER